MPLNIVRFERALVKNDLDFPSRGTANRNPAAGIISRTGNTVLNAAATDALREVIRLTKYAGDSIGVTAAVDLESGTVLLYVVEPTAPGSIVCGFRKNRNAATIHLHSVFAQHPDLAVTERMFCPVTLGQDNTDAYCLAVALRGVRPAGRRPRTSVSAARGEAQG